MSNGRKKRKPLKNETRKQKRTARKQARKNKRGVSEKMMVKDYAKTKANTVKRDGGSRKEIRQTRREVKDAYKPRKPKRGKYKETAKVMTKRAVSTGLPIKAARAKGKKIMDQFRAKRESFRKASKNYRKKS